MSKIVQTTVSDAKTQTESSDVQCLDEYCRILDEKDIPLSKRFQIRLGFQKKAFSIESPFIPNQNIDYYYAYCKFHGYYQTYLHGSGYLECPEDLKKRL